MERSTRQPHTVPCTLEITEEGAVVRYREAAEAGLGETESVLRLGEAEAVLERTGDTRTRMRFVVGQRHRVDYETAAGALRLEVRTTFLSHNVTRRRGEKAMIRYHLSSGGETVANHTLKIKHRGESKMTNLIQQAKDQVLALTGAAYAAAAAAGALPADVEVRAGVEIPKDTANGDYTTTFALAAAKAMKKKSPGDRPDAAGQPGSLRQLFCLRRDRRPWLSQLPPGPVLVCHPCWRRCEREGDAYGTSDALAGAEGDGGVCLRQPHRPPCTWATPGAACWGTPWPASWRPTAPGLAGVLRQTTRATRSRSSPPPGGPLPPDHSGGRRRCPSRRTATTATTSRSWPRPSTPSTARATRTSPGEERHAALARFGLDTNIPKMKEDLRRYKIEYDQWFFESSLHESGYVAETVEKLTAQGCTYEKDGGAVAGPPAACCGTTTASWARATRRSTSWT